MKLKIMVDSSSGITQDEAARLGIDVFPLRIIFNEKEYLDGIDIMQDEFYEKLTKEEIFPKTSLPNLYEIEKKVKEYLKEGYQVIILPLSKEISGTYSALVSMMEEYENVRVIDTLTTICGLRFLVNEALKLEVDNLDELEIKLCNLQKRIRIIAGIDTLEYLYKGGRLTKTASLVGNVIGLKPLISVIDGKVVVLAKRRGRKHAMQYVLDKFQTSNIDYNYPVYGIYSMNKMNYQELYNALTDEKLRRAVQNYENIAPVIGCHVGPGAYGFVFIDKE
jgi:hypothetical protein